VTNALDTTLVGDGVSLREAIQSINAGKNINADVVATGSAYGTNDTILFNIPGTGVQTINLSSSLDTILNPVLINGTSQPGHSGSPLIVLNGALAGTGSTGLTINGGNSTVLGLVINQFSGNGIWLKNGGGNLLQNNYIGTDSTGTQALGNGTGVFVDAGASGSTIGGLAQVTAGGGLVRTVGNLISGNTGSGIELAATAVVEGNYIGTDIHGTAALGNHDGVFVLANANGETVGGTGAGAGNVISGNSDGVRLLGTSGDQVQGNLIGTDYTGTAALGNSNGVLMGDGGNNNLIGGLDTNAVGAALAGGGNVIAGNGNGVYMSFWYGSTPMSGNVVEGNYIGTNITGTAALGNLTGVAVGPGTSGNTVGGTTAAARNVISGNTFDGVELDSLGNSGTLPASNVITGNYIGTDASGSQALGNGTGVAIVGGSNNQIGGTTSGAGNVISSNTTDGVDLQDSGNILQGNLIGLNAAGNAALGNGVWGVYVNASGNTIGGADTNAPGAPLAGAGNVISGQTGTAFDSRGYYAGTGIAILNGNGNVIQGNYIGTDITGELARGNVSAGIYDAPGGNTIGGAAQVTAGGGLVRALGNVVSGNGSGIDLNLSSVITGNYIGTDARGTAALGNHDGLFLRSNVTGLTVGGTTAGAGNVISGNSDGVRLLGTSGDQVQGNLIGTDYTGTAALGNSNGVLMEDGGNNNLIGGLNTNAVGAALAGGGNVIAGNGNGVYMSFWYGSTPMSGNVVEGNYIGTNITGTAALGNLTGVAVGSGTSGNTVGGTTVAARNLISGNVVYGVQMGSLGNPGTLPANNVVTGNYIGTDATGSHPLGNGTGVSIDGSKNQVGGTNAGQSNLIADNGASGVLVHSGSGSEILGNSIYNNGSLGISVASGANNNQAAPVPTSASTSSGGTTISGTLASVASTTFRLEFFANQAPDPSGFGEGQTYLGSIMVTTDAGGNASFTGTGLAAVPAGQAYLTATATNLTTNDTSAFSHDGILTTAVLTSSANPSLFGQPATFTATISPYAAGAGTPTGSVAFVDTTSNTSLGSASLSGGTATLTTRALNAGTHGITATYGGDGTFLISSVSLTQTITPSILVLNATASGALGVSGNASINIPGNLVVDSSSKSALTEAGNASITAASIQVVGGVSTSGSATLTPAATTGAASVADPLAGLTGPSTTGLTNYGSVSYSKGSYTLNPGIYTSIKASGNASLTLNPGLYLIEGGGFTVTGNASVSGSGVTLYNTSSTYPSSTGSYGGITLGGNGTISLSAPTSGPYAGVVIFQPSANTRAISMGGNAAAGLSGTIYAPAALAYFSGNASVNGALVVNELSLTGNAASTQAVDSSDVSGGSTAGQLLAGDLLVYINDPAGLFTADELARIQDAVNTLNAVVAPYGISVSETTDSTAANVTVDTGSTSAAGGYSGGVLGCYTTTGEITMIQGWNWYAGSDPTQIGSTQYDFETTLTHELGHALGLGESSTSTSAMYGTLATGTTIRTLTTADLAIPYADAGADAQRAADFRAPAADVEAVSGSPAASPGVGSAGRDLVFAALAADRLPSAGGGLLARLPVAAAPALALAEGTTDAVRTTAQARVGQPLLAAWRPEEDEQDSFTFTPVPDAGQGTEGEAAADPSGAGVHERLAVPRLLGPESDNGTPPANPAPTEDRPDAPARSGGTQTRAVDAAWWERVCDLCFAADTLQKESPTTLAEGLAPVTAALGMTFLLQDGSGMRVRQRERVRCG
jgi:titin